MKDTEDMTATQVIAHLEIDSNYFYRSIMINDPIPCIKHPITGRKIFKLSDVEAWKKKRAKKFS